MFFSLSDYQQRAITHDIPISSEWTINLLKSLLENKRPTQCLELWSAVGWWSYHIAKTVAQWNGQLTSVEVSYPPYHSACQFLHHHNVWNTTLYHCDIDSFPFETIIQSPLEFVYIDALKASYREYYSQLLPLLSHSCTLVFDDMAQYAHKIGPLQERLIQDGRTCSSHETDWWEDMLLIATR